MGEHASIGLQVILYLICSRRIQQPEEGLGLLVPSPGLTHLAGNLQVKGAERRCNETQCPRHHQHPAMCPGTTSDL